MIPEEAKKRHDNVRRCMLIWTICAFSTVLYSWDGSLMRALLLVVGMPMMALIIVNAFRISKNQDEFMDNIMPFKW